MKDTKINPFQTTNIKGMDADNLAKALGISEERASIVAKHMSGVVSNGMRNGDHTWSDDFRELTSIAESVDEVALIIYGFTRFMVDMESRNPMTELMKMMEKMKKG